MRKASNGSCSKPNYKRDSCFVPAPRAAVDHGVGYEGGRAPERGCPETVGLPAPSAVCDVCDILLYLARSIPKQF